MKTSLQILKLPFLHICRQRYKTKLQEVEISGKPTLPVLRVLLRARRLEPCRDQVLRIPGAGTENQEHGFLHTGYLSCVAQPPGRKIKKLIKILIF